MVLNPVLFVCLFGKTDEEGPFFGGNAENQGTESVNYTSQAADTVL
jgi:hypothetical protein